MQKLEKYPETTHTGGVIEMTDPQVWTLIGGFLAALIALITIMTQLMMRSIQAIGDSIGYQVETVGERVNAVRNEMNFRFTEVERQMHGLDKRIDGIEVQVKRIDKRVEGIDRDVQALMKRDFPL